MTMQKRSFVELTRTLGVQAEIAALVQELARLDEGVAKRFVHQLAQIVGVDTTGVRSASPRKEFGETAFGKVAAVFFSNGNKPLTKRDLAAAAGVGENSVHSLLYGERGELFEKAKNPEGGRERVVSLRAEAVKEVEEMANIEN